MPGLVTKETLDLVDLIEQKSAVAATFNTQRIGATETTAPVVMDDPALMMNSYDPAALEAGAVKASQGQAITSAERIRATALQFGEIEIKTEMLSEHILVRRTTVEDARDAKNNINLTAMVHKTASNMFANSIDTRHFIGGAPIGHDAGWWSNFVNANGTTRAQEFTTQTAVLEDIQEIVAMQEESNFAAGRWLLNRKARKYVRGLKTSEGAPLFLSNIRDDSNYSTLYDIPITWARHGMLPDEFLGVLYDPVFTMYAVRQDYQTQPVLKEKYIEHDSYGYPVRARVGTHTLSKNGHRPYTLWVNETP